MEALRGAFANVPLCRATDQVGCVVTYASFPASSPPGADSLFGSALEGGVAACTNPGALAGGSAEMLPYFLATEQGMEATLPPGVTIDTPYTGTRGPLTAECVERSAKSVLEVTANGDPTDTRDQILRGGLPANWGLHLADVNLAMGNLVALAEEQAEAYTG